MYRYVAGSRFITFVRRVKNLTATYAGDATFNGSTSGSVSHVAHDTPPSFTLTVTKAGDGNGAVTGAGIDCGAMCSNSYGAWHGGGHLPPWPGQGSVVLRLPRSMCGSRFVLSDHECETSVTATSLRYRKIVSQPSVTSVQLPMNRSSRCLS
ncbi:MAG: hypothetical protein MZV70_01035 [Desulfobacterales bacterium]|nr:hypothetical protein [Desulfobacterales bacterium]